MSQARPGVSSSAPFIGNLRVLKAPFNFTPQYYGGPPTYVEFKPEDPEFKTVKFAIHLGLSMLESHRGRRIMAKIGVENVKNHRRREETIRHTHKSRSMSGYVNSFLHTIRHDFFNIYLTSHIHKTGGAAEAQGLCLPTDIDIRNYKPKKDGGIMMSKIIIENIVHAARDAHDPATSREYRESAQRNFRAGIFQMGFATAHEILYKWVCYLTGGHVSSTLRTAQPGWFWETRFLGGYLDYVHDKSDPLGERQVGKIYFSTLSLSPAGKYKVEVTCELDCNYVQQTLECDFDYPPRAALNAPVIRRLLPNTLMERVRLAGIAVRFEFPFNPEQQDTINGMQAYRVLVGGPIEPSRVI